MRLQRPEEDGYRDDDEEPDMDVDAVVGTRGKDKTVDVEVVDEGYHDGESSLDIARTPGSPRRSMDVWKQLPERPLPDKPLPDVPRG